MILLLQRFLVINRASCIDDIDIRQRKLNCLDRLENLFFKHLLCYHRLLLKLSQLWFFSLILQDCIWSWHCNDSSCDVSLIISRFSLRILIVCHGKALLLCQTWLELYFFTIFWSWVNNNSRRSNWWLGQLRTAHHIDAVQLVLHGRYLVFPVTLWLLHQVFKSILLGHRADSSRRLSTAITASRLLLVQIRLLQDCSTYLLLWMLGLLSDLIVILFSFAAKVNLLLGLNYDLVWFLLTLSTYIIRINITDFFSEWICFRFDSI